MTEFEINGLGFRMGKLDAFRQFHLSRKIAPIIPTLIPVFVQISKGEGSLIDRLGDVAKLLEPFAEGLARMSDEDSEYVLTACLSVVQRNVGGKWAPIWSTQARACMFDDLDLGVLMQIAIKVIQDSLGPFIRGLLTSQQDSPTTTPAAG